MQFGPAPNLKLFMLNLRLKQLSVGLTRSSHTRAKKINVQATKDFGRRFRGEVFPVAEGHMRLKLHPEGLAAYIPKGEPLPLPELKASDAQQKRKELAAILKAQQEQEEVAEPTQPAQESREQKQLNKVKSFLDNLDFPAVNTTAKTEDNITAAQPETTQSSAGSADASAAQSEAPKDKKKFSWQNKFVVDITDKK